MSASLSHAYNKTSEDGARHHLHYCDRLSVCGVAPGGHHYGGGSSAGVQEENVVFQEEVGSGQAASE